MGGGGWPAIATGGMPNAVGGTNWLVATCCCNSVSGNGQFTGLSCANPSNPANTRLSKEPPPMSALSRRSLVTSAAALPALAVPAVKREAEEDWDGKRKSR
jgi:transcription initiation factor TFIID subunit TAF12